METKKDSCCAGSEKKSTGFLRGILYGILPHTFCILFIIFSVVGSVTATTIFKKVLVIPYFFTFLVIISFLFATVSAFIYLKKTDCFCLPGIKKKWKYLIILYATMILINLFFFTFIFPALANINNGVVIDKEKYSASLSIVVKIPCSGHAPLIKDELLKINGVGQVFFKMPNIFDVKYNSNETSSGKILSMEIFKTYEAIVK